jgi:hypothetical protein
MNKSALKQLRGLLNCLIMTEIFLIKDSLNSRLMTHYPTRLMAVETGMGSMRFVLILCII